MRIALALGSLAFSMSAYGADAYLEKVSSQDLANIRLEFQYPGIGHEMLTNEVSRVDSDPGWQKIEISESSSYLTAGTPDVPALRRLIAVDPDKEYRLNTVFEEPKSIEGVSLMPVISDHLESQAAIVPVVDKAAYLLNRELGAEGAVIESDSTMGGVRLLGLRIHPVRYNAATKKLTIYRKVSLELVSSGKDKDNFTAKMSISRFQAAQMRNLVMNGDAVLKSVPVNVASTVLIITSDSLLPKARQLTQAARLPDVFYEFATTTSVTRSSSQIKQLIKTRYDSGGLDAVLLYGDEGHVSLHNWSSSLPGDSYYGLIEGNDNYADIGLGRIPVTDDLEADVITEKFAKFSELQNLGHTNKRVLLAAHKENYPGKYTGNMENVRRAANPREFEFVTQYGGAGATNANVINLINDDEGFGFIAYRGHGSDTAWSSWDKNGQSFNATQVKAMTNSDEHLAIVISIACNNGAVQRSYHSLAEEFLFYKNSAIANHGAVGFLGATIESYTDTNHKFNEHLFRFLQNEPEIPMGQIVALANNQLVRDSGGSMPTNVKMYIYFGNPMLQPWLK